MTREREEDELSHRVVRALGHPLRVRLLRILSERVASPKQMAGITGEKVGDVAYHARVLADLECVELVDTVARRGATEHFYRAKPDAFSSSRKWEELPDVVRGEFAAVTFKELTLRMVDALEAGTFENRAGSTVLCMPIQVDEIGWEDIVKIVLKAERDIHKARKRASVRLHGEQGIPIVAALAAF